MGAKASAVQYSVPMDNTQEEGFSSIYRSQTTAKDGLMSSPKEHQKNLYHVWQDTLKVAGDKPFLLTKDAEGKFQAKTYKQIDEEATNIGSGLINKKLTPVHSEWKDYKLKFVGVFGPNREEWVIIDVCNAMYGNTAIPLYDSHGPENVTYVLKHTNLETCFIVAAKAQTIADCKDIGNLKNIVFMGDSTDEEKKLLEAKGLNVFSWNEVLEDGKKEQQPVQDVKPSDIYTFSYTSGTTGDPKGVMITYENVTSVVAVLSTHPSIKLLPSDRHMSYLPMAHVFERVNILGVMATGASAWFSKADPLVIKADLKVIKPTFFVSVPRLYNRFYDAINANLNAQTGFKLSLAMQAKETKLANLKNDCSYTHTLWDKLIFNKVKNDTFGGCVRFMITASAPLSSEVCDFLKCAVGCPLIEGYGQTESTGASFTTMAEDQFAGHVGGPTINTEFRLMDIPDMNYTAADKDEDGKPTPRGEICFRGPGIMAGYYKNEAKTNEAIINGWLHSGDVGKIMPNGSVKIIDRKKNLFKLAQGEYLAPEKIEQTLIRHEGVDEVWIHGDSLFSYCIAMIHPNEVFLAKVAKEANIEGDYAAQCANPDVVKAFLAKINAFGKKEKLSGFEIPKQIHLEKESIQTLGGMTPSFKLQRAECKKIFEKQIVDLYKAE